MFDATMLDSSRRHESIVMQAWRDAQPMEETIPRGSGGGGSGFPTPPLRTVVVIEVLADKFSCAEVDPATSLPTGEAFDVYPWVVDNGYIATGYDLRLTTGTVVVPRYTAGKALRVWSVQTALWVGQNDPPARWWAVDDFHLTCANA